MVVTIEQHQDEIIDAWATLAYDRPAMLDYLMDIGAMLPPIEISYKADHYLVQGCMSKVWLVDIEKDGLLFFHGDSNTAITKGLISLLIRILSGQSIPAIIAAKLYFVEAIGMYELVGFQRASGFAHMIKEVKLRAIARWNTTREAK